jgi:HEAT repeat protein
LVSTLKDKEKWVRTHSAQALGMLGPAAASAVRDLRLTLEDSEEIVRTNAAIALVRIGLLPEAPDTLVPVLTSACRGSIYAREAGEALQMLRQRDNH